MLTQYELYRIAYANMGLVLEISYTNHVIKLTIYHN